MKPISVFSAACLIPAILMPLSLLAGGAAGDSPAEIVVMSKTAVDDPVRDVDLIGVFSGPSGQSLVVPGFWDADRTFRLRFTPPTGGEWTYSTVSSDPALDGLQGTVPAGNTAGAFKPPAAGAPHRSLVGCSPDCAALFSNTMRPDFAGFRRADAAVAEAQGAGVWINIRLAAGDLTSTSLNARARSVMEYLVARYSAYPNVVWCAGSPAIAAGSGSGASIRGMLRTLDPYSVVNGWTRPVLPSCEDSVGDR